jgi:hypothetical protein
MLHLEFRRKIDRSTKKAGPRADPDKGHAHGPAYAATYLSAWAELRADSSPDMM